MGQDFEICFGEDEEGEMCMTIDGKKFEFDSEAPFPWQFMHEDRAMALSFDMTEDEKEIFLINGVNFNELPQA